MIKSKEMGIMNSSAMGYLVGAIVLANAVFAQQIIVDSFDGNGEIQASMLEPGTTCSIEWASSPGGPWTNTWADHQAIEVSDDGTLAAQVPMFYRVRGVPRTSPFAWDFESLEVPSDFEVVSGTWSVADGYLHGYFTESHAYSDQGNLLLPDKFSAYENWMFSVWSDAVPDTDYRDARIVLHNSPNNQHWIAFTALDFEGDRKIVVSSETRENGIHTSHTLFSPVTNDVPDTGSVRYDLVKNATSYTVLVDGGLSVVFDENYFGGDVLVGLNAYGDQYYSAAEMNLIPSSYYTFINGRLWDFEGTQMPSDLEVSSGTWNVADGYLHGYFTESHAYSDQGNLLLPENLSAYDNWMFSVWSDATPDTAYRDARIVLHNSPNNQHWIQFRALDFAGDRKILIASETRENGVHTPNSLFTYVTNDVPDTGTIRYDLVKSSTNYAVVVDGGIAVTFTEEYFNGDVRVGLNAYGNQYYSAAQMNITTSSYYPFSNGLPADWQLSPDNYGSGDFNGERMNAYQIDGKRSAKDLLTAIDMDFENVMGWRL